MKRIELLEHVRDLLSNAGFYVSKVYSMRPIGFDLVARRDNTLLIIKILTNINALPEDVANELHKLSELLSGHPLLIGLRAGNGPLEEEVVYDRFGIQAISPGTLKLHLLEGIPLQVYAAPGGFYVNIDTEQVKECRREKQISLGSFARSLHVSRRTVRMYEEGMNARVDVAFRMEELLNTRIIEDIHILQRYSKKISRNEQKESFQDHEQCSSSEPFQNEIFTLLRKQGYTIIPMGRCPFEAVSKEREKILLTSIQRYDERLKRKAEVISSISKITEKRAVMITDKKGTKQNIFGTPLVIFEELQKIHSPEELLELILERIRS
ncbi:MAG: transcriptional regulator [Candidatus Thermoplasmatota archaeon]|nr:transcriptional regulator [Candidatus Thermoplasmatota archaeon]